MRIGELAAAAGVSVQAIRFYERRSLLGRPARLASGYRVYRSDAVDRVRFIRNAQAVGYTLKEVAELLRLREGGSSSGRALGRSARAKLAALDDAIRRLQRMRDELGALLESCDCGRSGGGPCRVLRRLELPGPE